MRPARLVATLLLLAASPVGAQEHSSLLRVVVPDLPNDSRLMGFSLKIVAGRVAELRDVPPGWHVTIDNDPSWSASIVAHAIVGAAALETSGLASLFVLENTPAQDRLGPAETLKVSGSIEIMKNGDLHTVAAASIPVEPIPTP